MGVSRHNCGVSLEECGGNLIHLVIWWVSQIYQAKATKVIEGITELGGRIECRCQNIFGGIGI